MGSNILPHRRKIRGEPSEAWTHLKDTDLEEKWSSAREIPQHIRDYERSRWRLVYDDPDDCRVAPEDAAWEHLEDKSWESSYYYKGRIGDNGVEGTNIDASLLHIDSRVPVVQPEDSRPVVEWTALGGQAAMADLLNCEEERRYNFVRSLRAHAEWIEMQISRDAGRLDDRNLESYQTNLFGRRFKELRDALTEELHSDDPNTITELTPKGRDKIRIIAAVDAAERTKRYAARLRQSLRIAVRQQQIVSSAIESALAIRWAMQKNEHTRYTELVLAQVEHQRSYCKGSDDAIRARFVSAVCAMCGGSRLKIRRHPDYHWYSSCPDCEDMAPLRVSEVEAPTIPESQFKQIQTIRVKMSVALRAVRNHPFGIVPYRNSNTVQTLWWLPHITLGKHAKTP